MAEFEYSQDPDPKWKDRCFVTIDERYTISIVRTHRGLEIVVWPMTDGEPWEWPHTMLEILDSETAIDPYKRQPILRAE